MDISVLGEAYANFGKNGGALFMFVFGLFFNFALFKIYQLSFKHPTLLFWIPLLFLHVVKAEQDFTTAMNYFVKAAMLTAVLFWGLQRFFGIKM